MIFYSEEKYGHQSIFIKTVLNDDKEIIGQRIVTMPLYTVEKNGFTYFVLYDDEMNLIKPFYQYLNFTLRESPLTTRSKTAFSIRLLYCFLALHKYDIRQINPIRLRELTFFLRGINTNPEEYSMKTQRSNSTVNGYLSTYRTYFVDAKIKCDALFKSHTVNSSSTIGEFTSNVERKVYDNNLRTSNPNADSVPKYISPEEFKKLYQLALDKKDTTAALIMHLMYGYGFRLGEVLGLTIEDITERREHGKYIPVIYLRNRMSDKKFQFAKNLPHVIDKRQYRTADYSHANTRVTITYDLYEKLIDYVENIHPIAIEKYPNNYDAGYADVASIYDRPETNHYVFLNRYGKVLSDQTWNNCLKKYFIEAGIPLDREFRENNLSHRFRHGFAMFHAHFSKHPVKVLDLQKLMRHKAVSSTMVYYNPTIEDELKITEEFQEEFYSMMPELKEGLFE